MFADKVYFRHFLNTKHSKHYDCNYKQPSFSLYC